MLVLLFYICYRQTFYRWAAVILWDSCYFFPSSELLHLLPQKHKHKNTHTKTHSQLIESSLKTVLKFVSFLQRLSSIFIHVTVHRNRFILK